MEGQFKSLSISQPTNIQLDDLFDILDVWEELLRLGRLWTFFDTDYVETVANNIQMGMDNEVAWILINLEKYLPRNTLGICKLTILLDDFHSICFLVLHMPFFLTRFCIAFLIEVALALVKYLIKNIFFAKSIATFS